MLDPKLLRHEPEQVAENLSQRGFKLDIDHFKALEEQRHNLQTQTQSLQARRNQAAKAIGVAKAKGNEDAGLIEEASAIGQQLKTVEAQLETVQSALNDFQLAIPNLAHESVPVGQSESDNQEIRRFSSPKQFDFPVKDHIELGKQLGLMDFELAAKLSGSRFVVLSGALAHLQRALAQFMLDLHVQEHGYQEVYVPYLVHSKALYGTGQLPKFRDDQFNIAGDSNLSLIPTGEVSLTNLARESIFLEQDLPLKWVAETPCFRSEAGSYGKDTHGMIRQHQFQKVELVQLVKPEESYQVLETLTQHAEKVLQLLELPYRVVALCTADLGFAAAKTYDLEVWLPGQNGYREISSCSHCEAFQTRRMKARYRTESSKPQLLHSLNGSGLAVGRTLIALMENYQDAEGRIHIPYVLRPYLNGMDII